MAAAHSEGLLLIYYVKILQGGQRYKIHSRVKSSLLLLFLFSDLTHTTDDTETTQDQDEANKMTKMRSSRRKRRRGLNLTLATSSRLLTLLLLLVSYTPESLRWCSAYEAAHVQPPKDYFFTGGPGKLFLRHVKPYFFSYRGNAKARWLGRRIIDVYSSEFPLYSPAYYSAAISYGCITVNSKAVGVDYVVRNGDVIEHLVHRHEPPVLAYGNGEEAARVRIVADNPELLAVDKPPSVPVHPCGQYYHNSLLL